MRAMTSLSVAPVCEPGASGVPQIVQVEIHVGRDAGLLHRLFPHAVEVPAARDAALWTDEESTHRPWLGDVVEVPADVRPEGRRETDGPFADAQDLGNAPARSGVECRRQTRQMPSESRSQVSVSANGPLRSVPRTTAVCSTS